MGAVNLNLDATASERPLGLLWNSATDMDSYRTIDKRARAYCLFELDGYSTST